MCSTSVVHRVNLRGSQPQPPWFTVSTSVLHNVNLRGSQRQPRWFTAGGTTEYSRKGHETTGRGNNSIPRTANFRTIICISAAWRE